MYKKKSFLWLVCILVFVFMIGCSNTATDQVLDEGETASLESRAFVYAVPGNPETLDLTLASENVSIIAIINSFEGLVKVDDDGNVLPGVAESWEISEDLTEYTFHLREDAKWSDGESVKAADFVYSWQRAANPETAAEFAYFLFYLKNGEAIVDGEVAVEELGVEAIDERTLKVTLEAPVSYIFNIFAFPTYFPLREDIVSVDPEKWTLNPETRISNGPFVISDWKQNEVVILKKNEAYWNQSNVSIDEVHLQIISDSSTALAAYEAGGIDGTYVVPATEIPRLMVDNDEFALDPALIMSYLEFNSMAAPFDDIRVRRALTLAIDRSDITDKITLGGEKPAVGLVPFGIELGGRDFREDGGTYGIVADDSRVAEAQELLAEAGYPDGVGFPKITLHLPSESRNQRVGEALMEMWKTNLGIEEIELLPQESKVHYTDMGEGDFQVGMAGWLGDYQHPMSFLTMWESGSGSNSTQYNNEEFDMLIRDAKKSQDVEASLELMHQAEDLWMAQHVVCPLFYESQTVLVKEYVKGFNMSATSLAFFDKITIEE